MLPKIRPLSNKLPFQITPPLLFSLVQLLLATLAKLVRLPLYQTYIVEINKPLFIYAVSVNILDIIMDGEETKCKDSETELWYYSGESWNRKNCTKCVCFEGEISCMASVCSKPLCPNPVKKDGVCCPVCSDEYEQGINLTLMYLIEFPHCGLNRHGKIGLVGGGGGED